MQLHHIRTSAPGFLAIGRLVPLSAEGRRFLLQQAAAHCFGYRRCPIVAPSFSYSRWVWVLTVAHPDEQLLGHLRDGQPAGEGLQHLSLPVAERGNRRLRPHANLTREPGRELNGNDDLTPGHLEHALDDVRAPSVLGQVPGGSLLQSSITSELSVWADSSTTRVASPSRTTACTTATPSMSGSW